MRKDIAEKGTILAIIIIIIATVPSLVLVVQRTTPALLQHITNFINTQPWELTLIWIGFIAGMIILYLSCMISFAPEDKE